MKHYELVYLTRQEMAEDEAKKLQDKLADFIKSKQGTVTEIAKAYKKKLAYPVKRQNAAFVCSMRFQITGENLLLLKEEIRKDSSILRSLVVAYIPEPVRQRPVERNDKKPEDTATAPEEAKQEPVKEESVKKSAEKPKRREKPKADLAEIGEKLDEILK